jgi:hypothetical protein
MVVPVLPLVDDGHLSPLRRQSFGRRALLAKDRHGITTLTLQTNIHSLRK